MQNTAHEDISVINANTALILVDPQNDFCEGGSLAVTGGKDALARARKWIDDHGEEYSALVVTRDHHIDPGMHFAENPDFGDTWPAHCVAGSPGAELEMSLDGVAFDEEIKKGEYVAAYSGFEGHNEAGVVLEDVLLARGVQAVHVAGLATDYCVRATALDAKAAGFDVTLLADLAAGVGEDSAEAALLEMRAAGVRVVQTVIKN